MVGNVLSQGLSTITEMGVVYSNINHLPTIADSIASYTPISIGTFTKIFDTSPDIGLYYARAFATNSSGTSYGNVLTATSYICLAHGTMISMYDGTTKPIQDIEYTDTLKVWNFDDGCFDTAKPLWIKQAQTANSYNLLEFSNGASLKTIEQHRIFNKELGKFSYPMTNDTPLGTHTLSDSGEEIELLCKSVIIEEIKYYNVITYRHINMFANGILTSCRYNNIYPIVDMKFVKSSSEVVPKCDYNTFDDSPILSKYREGLRLDEQDIPLKDTINYIFRLEMLKKEKSMKVIFLDHQGVMYVKKHPKPGTLVDFDVDCVNILNSILESDKDIDIVVSSDWKYWVDFDAMKEFYKKQGIIKAPIDCTEFTDRLREGNITIQEWRAIQIKNWLSMHEVSHWVSVDDLDMRPYLNNFVYISEPLKGLVQSDVNKNILSHF